jgi:hypothetical protein
MIKALKNWFKENGMEAAQARAHERARIGLKKIRALTDEYEKEDDGSELASRILRVIEDEMKKDSSICFISYRYPDVTTGKCRTVSIKKN